MDQSINSNFEPNQCEVQNQIEFSNGKQKGFKIGRARKLPRLRRAHKDLKKLIEESLNPQCPAPELNLFSATTSKSSKDQRKSIKQRLIKEQNRTMKYLLKILSIPRRLIRSRIKLRNENIELIASLLITCVLCFCFYKIMILLSVIVSQLLNSAFLALKNKRSKETSKSEKESQIEESKKFWDKRFGYLSQVIQISRGGSLVPIREANIYNFSELDEQQALLSVSPILYYIKLERSKLELEKLIIESEQTVIQRKRFRLKLKKFFSNFKELISLPDRNDISKGLLIVIGSIVFLMEANSGTMTLDRIPNLYNTEIVVLTQPSVTSSLPRVETSIKEESQNIQSIMIESKDSLKVALNTPSRLKSGDRVRKKAKLVRLSDLPPLPKQASDWEIDSPLMTRPTSIKISLE